jgi:hypothetical protein
LDGSSVYDGQRAARIPGRMVWNSPRWAPLARKEAAC